jgi:hypothetical protein
MKSLVRSSRDTLPPVPLRRRRDRRDGPGRVRSIDRRDTRRSSEQLEQGARQIMADITLMAAAGCGMTAIYACLARPGEVPYCVAPGPAPPAFGAGAPSTD